MSLAKFKTVFGTAACAALSMCMIGYGYGQQNPPVSTDKPVHVATTYRAKQVIGSKVNIEGNLAIGIVDDLVFSDDGYIEYLIVNNDHKLVTVPWEAAKFNFEKRIAVVNITPERFREAPTYTVEQYPLYSTPAYRTQVYKFYNMTPRQQREAIRLGNPVPQINK